MERILHIGAERMGIGGIENFLMNVYRNIDREKYQFDFVVHSDIIADYDREIEQLGGRIYRVPRLSQYPVQNLKQVFDIVKKGNYKIVQRHACASIMWTDLLMAKLAGARIRIAHSHSSTCGFPTIHKIFCPVLEKTITHRFACGKVAGKWMYGEKKFNTIKNGIDTEKFIYEETIRMQMRELVGIKKQLVVGNAVRFDPVKNHEFLLKVFVELQNIFPEIVLLLVGDGELLENVKQQAKEMGISQNVIFVGASHEVNKWLQAMDICIFPSLYEGFPISVLEAETTGAYCVISDKVPSEINLTGDVLQIPLEKTAKEWARLIADGYSSVRHKERRQYKDIIRKAGYDIKDTAYEIEQFYDECIMDKG